VTPVTYTVMFEKSLLLCSFGLSLSLELSLGLTYFYGDGSYFQGSVDTSGRPKQGTLYNSDKEVVYSGTFKNGLFHGNGTWHGEHGHKYEGEFKFGSGNGLGTWTTDKGDVITGNFVNHTLNGAGVWRWPGGKGLRMEGNFKRGHAHGPGVMYFGDGTRFEGSFKKGYPDGQGKLINSINGTTFWTGKLRNGWPEGEISEREKALFYHFHTHPLRNVYSQPNKDLFSGG